VMAKLSPIRDEVVLKNLVDYLIARDEQYACLKVKHQHAIADMIFRLPTRSHRTLNGWYSIGYQYIRDSFGKNFKSINEKLGYFVLTPNWSMTNNQTRGYRFTEKLFLLQERYLASETSLSELMKSDGSMLRKVSYSAIDNGNPATIWKNTHKKMIVKIDVNAVERLIPSLVIAHAEADRYTRLKTRYAINKARELIKAANTRTYGRGKIAMRYFMADSGRLYGKETHHLQNIPKLIRNAALTGCYDYDVENCHYTLLSQLAKRVGFDCPAINHYISNKQAVRQQIAQEVGITIDQAKTCLLMVMYGAEVRGWHECSIPKEIGKQKTDILLDNILFMSICADIRLAGMKVVAGWGNKTRRTLVNQMGKKMPLLDPNKNPTLNKYLVAHILQGLEAYILKTAIELYGSNIVLYLHDGFVTRVPIDTALLVAEIKCRLHINIGLSMEEPGT